VELGWRRTPSPGLHRLLLRLLHDPSNVDPTIGDAVMWIGAPLEERSRTLEDLLRFVDALPPRPAPPLRFPPLTIESHA
jgi:hypothetical protein